jgi:hypothetical protein
MKINKKSLYQFSPLSEAKILGLHLAHFLAWFQSLQLSSTQSVSPVALIHLAPKSHVSFNVCTRLETEFFIFHTSIRIIGHPD